MGPCVLHPEVPAAGGPVAHPGGGDDEEESRLTGQETPMG